MRGDSWVRDSSKLLREKMFKNGKCVVYDEFDEDLHPRDEKGQFTSGGGESGGSGGGELRQLGSGDLSGTKVGNTTYEQFSKMGKDEQFSMLEKQAEDKKDFAGTIKFCCEDILQDYTDGIAEENGIDPDGEDYNPWDVLEHQVEFDYDLADKVVNEWFTDDERKECMNRVWDYYAE